MIHHTKAKLKTRWSDRPQLHPVSEEKELCFRQFAVAFPDYLFGLVSSVWFTGLSQSALWVVDKYAGTKPIQSLNTGFSDRVVIKHG